MPWIICNKDILGSSLYTSLFIDSILGLFFGYHLSLCINKFALDKFTSICVVLSGSCLVLIKDSAILFALAGIIGGVICSGKYNSKKFIGKDVVFCAVASLAAILATWGSWRFMLNRFSVTNHLATEMFLPDKKELSRFITTVFMRSAADIDLIFIIIQTTLPAAISIILFIKFFFGIINKDTDMKKEITDAIIQIICYIFFVMGYFVIFRDRVNSGEYPSYTRYMCTLILCSLYILGYDMTAKYHDLLLCFGKRLKRLLLSVQSGSRVRKTLTNVMSVFICVILTFMCFRYVYVINRGSVSQIEFERVGTITYSSELAKMIADAVPQSENPVDVYFCAKYEEYGASLIHHLAYFNLIDDNIRIRNWSSEIDISSRFLGYSPDRFVEVLAEGDYDYVVFTEIDDVFYDEFKDILGDVSVGDQNVIYSVDHTNNCLIRS